MGDIINQVLDALKNRPTLFLDEPLAKGFSTQKLPPVKYPIRSTGEKNPMTPYVRQLLPPRGTGSGRAEERRAGRPRGFLERLQRHYG